MWINLFYNIVLTTLGWRPKYAYAAIEEKQETGAIERARQAWSGRRQEEKTASGLAHEVGGAEEERNGGFAASPFQTEDPGRNGPASGRGCADGGAQATAGGAGFRWVAHGIGGVTVWQGLVQDCGFIAMLE